MHLRFVGHIIFRFKYKMYTENVYRILRILFNMYYIQFYVILLYIFFVERISFFPNFKNGYLAYYA